MSTQTITPVFREPIFYRNEDWELISITLSIK